MWDLMIKVNPSLAGEFSTAAFRFGHTLVKSSIKRSDGNGVSKGSVNLSDIIFRPVEAYKYLLYLYYC